MSLLFFPLLSSCFFFLFFLFFLEDADGVEDGRLLRLELRIGGLDVLGRRGGQPGVVHAAPGLPEPREVPEHELAEQGLGQPPHRRRREGQVGDVLDAEEREDGARLVVGEAGEYVLLGRHLRRRRRTNGPVTVRIPTLVSSYPSQGGGGGSGGSGGGRNGGKDTRKLRHEARVGSQELAPGAVIPPLLAGPPGGRVAIKVARVAGDAPPVQEPPHVDAAQPAQRGALEDLEAGRVEGHGRLRRPDLVPEVRVRVGVGTAVPLRLEFGVAYIPAGHLVAGVFLCLAVDHHA